MEDGLQSNVNTKNRTYKTYVLLLVALVVGFLAGRESHRFIWRPVPPELQKLEEEFPKVSLEPETEASPAARLRVLNGRVSGIYEEVKDTAADETAESAPEQPAPQVRLAGLRILGEFQNIGAEKVYGAKAILRFYDSDEKLVTTKVGTFNQSFTFLPLDGGDINLYDVLVPEPPASETISIEMRAEEGEKGEEKLTKALKVKDRSLEKDVLKRKETEVEYFKFAGKLVNTTDFNIANPGLYVWIKNDENEVIGMAKKVYEADILTPGQEMDVSILILPSSTGETFGSEVKTFGEKL